VPSYLIVVPKQRLDDSDIGTAIEQMGCKAVSKCLQCRGLLDSGRIGRFVEQAVRRTGSTTSRRPKKIMKSGRMLTQCLPSPANQGEKQPKCLISLARPTRFERVTFAFGGHRGCLSASIGVFCRHVRILKIQHCCPYHCMGVHGSLRPSPGHFRDTD
jgi:hypothetical protein